MIKKILLTFLLAFISFFAIDKVCAVSITSYDEHPGWISYKTNDNWITNNKYRQLFFAKINYYMTDVTLTNQRPNEFMFQYYITPNSDTNSDFNMIFQVYAPDTRGLQVIVGNDVCQVSPASFYSNTTDANTDRRFGPVYNVECQNRNTANPINVILYPVYHVNKVTGSYSIGISRMYFSDSLTTMNAQLRSIQETISQSDYSVVQAIDETNQKLGEQNKKLDEANKQAKETNDTLKNDNVDESASEAQSFFEGFTTDTFGLTSVITAPLTLIGNLATTSCSAVPLSVPYVGGTLSLPCMTPIYEKHFKSFFDIYQSVTFGLIAYWVCVKVFALVKEFKNPDNDEIEVMDL